MESPLLKITGLTKTYSGVTVLNGVSFSVERNSILGLIGENGAGKSTLIKCINGVVSPDCGTLFFNGREYRPEISAALKNGIVTIPQEFNLADTLTVRENIFLGRELKRHGFLNHSAMRRETQRLLDELRSDLSPDAPVETLSIAQKQLVEIARAVSRECRLLIMDEPSTVLNPPEVQNLFRIMRQLKENGAGIIYVSHKLNEVKEICDTVTVLRDGSFICQEPAANLSVKEMANRMVGRELKGIFPPKHLPVPDAPVVLEVENLLQSNRVRNVSFSLRRGEILRMP